MGLFRVKTFAEKLEELLDKFTSKENKKDLARAIADIQNFSCDIAAKIEIEGYDIELKLKYPSERMKKEVVEEQKAMF